MFIKMKVLLPIVLFGMFVESGTSNGGNHNADESKLLCDVLRMARGILNNTKEIHKKDLKDAIYGSSETNYEFGEDGKVSGGSRCISQNLRTQLCTYNGQEGCYAQSLLGTLFCVCTPGGKTSTEGTLCETALANYGGKGWWDQSQEDARTELFKKVWAHVVEACHCLEEMEQTYDERLEALSTAVQKARKQIKNGVKSGSPYSLRGSGTGECSGTSIDSRVCGLYNTVA
ncbi:unnamed protein product [Trypanosoma congolense IL3000]|uniref:WGS project CAEQ00000000 data, annotated contig 1191 n=1 Tax=Trypanosoma congolense (strain IL3000) TaxID=1068625 RepID=F9W4J9_TRYCI|nr:unnamed protein product [Trypanosoma congolense IL3000]